MNTARDQQVAASPIAGRPAIASARVAADKFIGFRHLLWKEYRSIRLFWISMLALTVAIQLLLLLFSQDKTETVLMIYHFALGAPAFFAIGAAGASFAAEKEEGTFDFLRASPIRAGQIVASKLFVVFLSTTALLAALWPIAYLLADQQLPDAKILPGLLGLWLTGALEAIAWGTLFSLLGARPLLAIVLAMATASTCAHLISWQFRAGVNLSFDLLSYYYSAPWRMLMALSVVMVDVYLGLHWLAGGVRDSKLARQKLSALAIPGQGGGDSLPPSSLAPALLPQEPTQQADFQKLLVKRSRAAMLGRLLWQHWRQSWKLMLVMSTVFVVFGFLASVVWIHISPIRISGDQLIPLFTLAIFSTLIGAMVFLTDQERRNYRFFAEHNIPPRFVWMTRQFWWTLIVVLGTFAICYCWLIKNSNVNTVWNFVRGVLRCGHSNYNDSGRGMYLYLPPIDLGLALALVGYAAGQWASMMIRSGVMAGFVGLLVSAALCGWTLLMHTMQVSFWWSVLPIPVVLLVATWLRAPDWISENRRKAARAKAACAILIPVGVLMVAMPYYRVHEIPNVSPGFDVDQYEAKLKSNLEASLATTKLYQQAQAAYRSMDWGLEGLPGVDRLDESLQIVVAAHRAEIEAALNRAVEKGDDRATSLFELAVRYSPEIGQALTENEKQWLDANQQALDLLVRAAERGNCLYYDPASDTRPKMQLAYGRQFIRLMLTSARQLEAEGKLDEALDRYLLTLRTVGDVFLSEFFYLSEWEMNTEIRRVFSHIANWAGKPGQTPERLRAAIDRLQALDASDLRMEDFVKNNFILASRIVEGNTDLLRYHNDSNHPEIVQSEILWSMLMPWENARAARVLKVLTRMALYRFRQINLALQEQGEKPEDGERALGQMAAEGYRVAWLPHEQETIGKDIQSTYLWELKDWISTTNPDLLSIEQLDREAASQVIYFEAQKRGAMLVLAIQAYGLEHGQLPKSLADLQGDYFKRWPLDPYSGSEFRYFPSGVPLGGTEEATSDAAMEIWHRDGGPPIRLHQPGVWSTSPQLEASVSEGNEDDSSEAVNPRSNVKTWHYYLRSNWAWQNALSFRDALQNGYWFPIPVAGTK